MIGLSGMGRAPESLHDLMTQTPNEFNDPIIRSPGITLPMVSIHSRVPCRFHHRGDFADRLFWHRSADGDRIRLHSVALGSHHAFLRLPGFYRPVSAALGGTGGRRGMQFGIACGLLHRVCWAGGRWWKSTGAGCWLPTTISNWLTASLPAMAIGRFSLPACCPSSALSLRSPPGSRG